MLLWADDVLECGTKLTGKSTVCDDHDADHVKLLILCRRTRLPRRRMMVQGFQGGKGKATP
jgi:hypothetical protein